jgi:hypothetical protein
VNVDCVIWVLKARNSLGITERMGQLSQRRDWTRELLTESGVLYMQM